ncbi:Rhodanese-like domain-containing protein [Stachybotrys elegans]|uniref:Rhodanese-like domain-containing protein n=1 Tax=Stachybotrys elegans TaxID=80388 RepID=A0A8K0SST9_9HYPO|nr:Rhodanese-like domain-containing protein [Stachybotrys elegans]
MASAAVFLCRPTRSAFARGSFQGRRFNMATARSFSSYLVTPAELHQALKKNPPSPISPDPRVIPLCAAWFLPNDGRTGIEVFREQRIPKARFFDLDKVSDRRSPYPHMLPNAKNFASAMSELGIRKDDIVVVYDSKELGIFSAPRVGWTLKAFGHSNVHILDNFKLWVEQGLPTESGELYSVECSSYPIPDVELSQVASFEDVREVALDYNKEGAEGVQILDARPNARFLGKAPEPRDGLSSGHMPGSISIPFSDVLNPETKSFLEPEKLAALFKERGVDPAKPIISSCGTGVTACVIDTALEIAKYGSPETRRVYDGSWTEWAQRVRPSDNLIQKAEE